MPVQKAPTGELSSQYVSCMNIEIVRQTNCVICHRPDVMGFAWSVSISSTSIVESNYPKMPSERTHLEKPVYNKKDRNEELYGLVYDPHENVNLLIGEVYESNRNVSYRLNEVYYYPRWDEARRIYLELRGEKDRIWRSRNPLVIYLRVLRDSIGKHLP